MAAFEIWLQSVLTAFLTDTALLFSAFMVPLSILLEEEKKIAFVFFTMQVLIINELHLECVSV